ncbi:hypothetical protein MKX01_018798 [Papaver californicum]|nr:hypothetical protein MKX01_018798 [Papaver californicum]
MAISLLSHEVSDLCLGKPALRSLSISATISDALSVLKFTGENYISIWGCDHSDLLKISNNCGEEEKFTHIIDPEILAVGYHDPASSAVTAISNALAQQTSVAVIDELGKLLGEISPLTLSNSEETVAAAITTLSAGDLVSYIDCGGPPSHLIKMVKTRLEERNLQGMLDLIQELIMSKSSSSSSQAFSSFWSSSSSSSSSSDDECASTLLRSSSDYTPTRSNSMSTRLVRRSEAIVCNPRSSLLSVMIQALAHRVNYVWVIEDDCTLVGIVTFSEMLKIFRENLNSI